MDIFSGLQTALDALHGALGDADPTSIPATVQRLDDDALLAVIGHATALVRAGESVRIAASGAVAARSSRDAGHSGLAQKRGHRSAVSLIQDLTGSTRADASKQVRIGEALAAAVVLPVSDEGDESLADAVTAPPPWHAQLGDALMTGKITSAQHDAIYRGLGEPPATLTRQDGAGDPAAGDPVAGDPVAESSATGDSLLDVSGVWEAWEAWAIAAGHLIDEAAVRTVEELTVAARTVRDLLDPEGAERRFDERFAARSFRTWTDRDGITHGSFIFDDVGAVSIDTIIATALRPRRGGPRFVDTAEAARAQALTEDPRTNDQLAYDLMMDLIRAGSLADAATVFGTRQAGIRIIATHTASQDALDGRPAVALVEDTGATLPGWLIAQRTCDGSTTTITLDPTGNPLNVGREQRLFTPKQRIALAIRDGGCCIPGCDRPASYTEAHHIDPYSEGGRTDIDRGILLCAFHHMNLHHHDWRITRNDKEDFVLHRPGLPQIRLPMRLARRYDFGDLAPPPRTLHPVG